MLSDLQMTKNKQTLRQLYSEESVVNPVQASNYGVPTGLHSKFYIPINHTRYLCALYDPKNEK
jgi:hypothetical protein